MAFHSFFIFLNAFLLIILSSMKMKQKNAKKTIVSFSRRNSSGALELRSFHIPVTSYFIVADSHTKSIFFAKQKTKRRHHCNFCLPPPSSLHLVRILCTFCISFVSHSIHDVQRAKLSFGVKIYVHIIIF